MKLKVGDLLRLLAEDGWYRVRTRGSHQQLRHHSKPGSLNSILKQAGLK